MKKTRIAFFAETLTEEYDGAVRTMYQLISRINIYEFDFLFICGQGPEMVGGFRCLHVPAIILPINTNYTMALPLLAQRKLNEALNDFAPDIVHIATPSLLGQFAVKFGNREQLPVISIYHTHFVSYVDYYLKKLPFLIGPVKSNMWASHKIFYNNCDKLYVPSVSIAQELAGTGIERHRLRIWERGVDRQLFSPAKRNIAWMRRLTGNQHPVILFASRLVWEKNLDTLFRIYDCLEAEGSPLNFIVAGDGIAMEACRKRMGKAIFMGTQNHQMLAKLYASSDVFVFPSVSEAYGNVVLEAMASGLPCVIADGGGSKDFVRQGVNGFLCSPYDEKEYCEKIRLLLADKWVWQKFSDEGRDFSGKFDWEDLSAIYFNELRTMAGLGKQNTAPAA